MKSFWALSAALGVTAALQRPALAALTDSEKAVVRTFIAKGVADTAGRVRALVARPDLEPEEIASALRQGYLTTPFDAAHVRFTEALLFGPGSDASRSTLVPAVVDALLGRAASRMADVPLEVTAKVDASARAAAEEVLAIHAFVDSRIANAGNPPPDGHDVSAAIRDDALKSAALLYKAHFAAHDRWFSYPGRAAEELVRIRVQAELAGSDLARGIFGRHEIGEWIGLRGAARGVYDRTGVIVDANGAEATRLAHAVELLESAPGATDGLSVWLVSKASPMGLVARGRIERAPVPLGDSVRPIDASTLWAEEVTPSSPDAAITSVAFSVAELATDRAFATDPSIAESARLAVEHASVGDPRAYLAPALTNFALDHAGGRSLVTPRLATIAAVELLLLDGARAVDLAAIRAGEGRPEPLEQIAVALAVLADGHAKAKVGVTREGGEVALVDVTDLKRDGGVVRTFTIAGKHYAIAKDGDGALALTIDGKAPKLTSLPSFRERTAAGVAFNADGVDYERLYGEPRAAGLDDGSLVVDGSHGGFDALATGTDLSDVDVSAVIRPTGAGGGLVVRATAGDTSYTGVGLILEPDAAHAELLLFDGQGKAVQLAEPVPLGTVSGEGVSVSLQVAGAKVSAKVGAKVLTANIVRDVGPGRVAVVVRADARLEIRHLKIAAHAGK